MYPYFSSITSCEGLAPGRRPFLDNNAAWRNAIIKLSEDEHLRCLLLYLGVLGHLGCLGLGGLAGGAAQGEEGVDGEAGGELAHPGPVLGRGEGDRGSMFYAGRIHAP